MLGKQNTIIVEADRSDSTTVNLGSDAGVWERYIIGNGSLHCSSCCSGAVVLVFVAICFNLIPAGHVFCLFYQAVRETPVFAVARTGVFLSTNDVPNPPLTSLAAVAGKPDH